MDYKEYDEKYADLLVKKCLVNKKDRPLVIMFSEELASFANICFEKAKEAGYKEVILFNKKNIELRKYINSTDLDDIKMCDLLDRSILENKAKENSNYLYLETFVNDDNKNAKKKQKVEEIIDSQLKIYYENTSNLKCPWCVACYPNREWAKKIYPNMTEEKAYEKLYFNIMKMCQIDKDDPIKEWDEIRNKYLKVSKKLNDLKIKKLHYENSLGTDLNIYLPDNHLWIGADDKDYFGNDIIVNMPGYEIFTSPIYNNTEGIVYSSKPLYYRKVIESFGLEFKNGKVINIITNKEEDKKILSEIINKDNGSKYLGECAIVEANTPVNETNTLYYELLYDENASCHLALGSSYPDTLEGGLLMDEKSLEKNGLNNSNTHVDFMIGTDDLKIEADTKNGKKLIYSNGKLLI